MRGELLYQLTKNDALQRVSARISQTPPDWEKIGRFLGENAVQSRINGAAAGRLSSTLGEVHLRVILEEAAAEIPGLVLEPIPDGTKTGRFRFQRTGLGGGYVVIDQRLERCNPNARYTALTQYDALFEADGLVTVLELKMGRIRNASDAFSPPRINRILWPLSDYFQTREFGYMVVLPRDQVNEGSQRQQRLIEAGGLVTPLTATAAEFLLGVNVNRRTWMVRWPAQYEDHAVSKLGDLVPQLLDFQGSL